VACKRFLILKFSSFIAILLEYLSVTLVNFTGDQYEVSGGGMTSIVPVPADEFLISFNSSGSETHIFLLAGDDVMTSDMIIVLLSSHNSFAAICTARYLHHQIVSLPYKENRISRRCYTQNFNYKYNVSTHSHFQF